MLRLNSSVMPKKSANTYVFSSIIGRHMAVTDRAWAKFYQEYTLCFPRSRGEDTSFFYKKLQDALRRSLKYEDHKLEYRHFEGIVYCLYDIVLDLVFVIATDSDVLLTVHHKPVK